MFFRINLFVNEEKDFKEEDQSIQMNYLKEENYLLKDIIDRAATSIADVIQVYRKESLDCEEERIRKNVDISRPTIST